MGGNSHDGVGANLGGGDSNLGPLTFSDSIVCDGFLERTRRWIWAQCPNGWKNLQTGVD